MKTITYDENKYVLVPVEPTPEMLSAAIDAGRHATFKKIPNIYRRAYRAMLAAQEVSDE